MHTHTCTPNKNRVQFVLAGYSLAWNLIACYTQCHSIEENIIFPLPRTTNYKNSLARCEFYAHFPSSVLGFCPVWACECLEHAVQVSVRSYVYLPYWLWKKLFSWSHLPLTMVLFPLPCRSLVPDINIPIMTGHSEVSHPLNIIQFWVSVLITTSCKKFFWWVLSCMLICGYSNVSSGVTWLL